MADPTVPQVVRSYLVQLERALAGLPADVREEIVAGVREELDGLDAAAAAARIEALGDPEFIGAEAREETGATAASGTRNAPTGTSEPRWYAVLASLLVAFGGVVIPVIGWIVGIAMVVMSKSWRRADKWVAVLTPFVAAAALPLCVALISLWSPPLNGPSGVEDPNPLIPHAFDVVWSSVVLIIPVNAVVGIWLLWRAKRSWGTEAPQLPQQERYPSRPRRPQASWYAPVTVLLIIAGGFVIPFVGWVIGVTMLWAADAWSVRDKWLGTLVGPLVVLVPMLLLLVVRLWLPAGGGGFDPFLLIILVGMALPTIANVLVGIRLLRRANSGSTAGISGG